jgi:putative Holliday junction resolvase
MGDGKMRYLAIDYGTKGIGLAICDAAETIASPLTVIQGQKNLFEKIAEIVEREDVEAIVVGLPLNMDDSRGFQAELVIRFAEQLEKYVEVPIHFQDERLSTFESESKLASVDLSKKKKKKHIDAIAAATILESFLETKKTM